MTLVYVEEHPIIDAIKQFFIDEYCVSYEKRTQLFIDDEGSYVIYISLNNVERPLMIGGQFESDEEFTEYVKKELRKTKPHWIGYFSGYQVNQPIVEEMGFHDPRFAELEASQRPPKYECNTEQSISNLN